MQIKANRIHAFTVLAFASIVAAAVAAIKIQPDKDAGKAQTPAGPAADKDELMALEKRTIDIYREVSPSVVSVANRAIIRDLYNFRVYEVPQGAGSGFVWDKKGHIISNFHVVYEASSILVTLRDGAAYEAKVIGLDPDHDIAVLKIEAPEAVLVPIKPGNSAGLRVGQSVFAIGNPFGLDTSLSSGVVSALGRSIMSLTGRQIYDVIQTDAAINPGNSGGPLLDSAGRLIGINTVIVSPSGAYAGIGFAVPADTVNRIVPQLIAKGKVSRAGLGIEILPDHIAAGAGIEGVAILRVMPGSAAARSGLQGSRLSSAGAVQIGDVIVSLDGTAVRNSDDFLKALDVHQAGDTVKLVYIRDKKKQTTDIVLQNIE